MRSSRHTLFNYTRDKFLIPAGLQSDDEMIRMQAARRAIVEGKTERFMNSIQILRDDPFMPIRREWLLAQINWSPESADAALIDSLLDRSASIRELAQFYLRKSSRFDLAAYYRRTTAEGKNPVIAICGIGETGSATDVKLVQPYLKSASPRVRRTAVRALARIGGDEIVDLLLECLADESPAVARQVSASFKGKTDLVDTDKLWCIFREDRRFHVRARALDLFDHIGKWKSLPYLIRASIEADSEISSLAQKHIRDWFSSTYCVRFFVEPTTDELDLILVAIGECRGKLAPELLGRFYLGSLKAL